MDKFDKILNQLKDASGDMKANMHMLNEIVPVEEQMKYFQYSKYVQSQDTSMQPDRNYMIGRLFTPNVNIEDKRYYLSALAIIADVAAYRAIETYHSSPLEPELANWSALALTESKILLDADLSGEKQFFVSTGLGGRDGKLRYFSVIASKDRTPFTDFQKETILKELKFAYEASEIEVESIDFKGNYLKVFLLCDLKHDPRSYTEEAIKECNDMGDFVDKRFLLTNVKLIKDSEIEELLEKKDTDSKTE
ncbi:hypothetical protein [Dysgonomonas macrotermitis]|uniref:Uncharacterized protein n=1 Tax=Dysgonomonas macrotermitis TaxID=1346286 RepID=A0A1M5APS0_9BACT|nr:hypothetical protein [Dysgonomonas macrotermitis]SHF32248.1 hypothetical protein SAMN05444362_105123 [Dysgonomonas macrotermitis]